jgi:predicted amidophosphoribosyltransferase
MIDDKEKALILRLHAMGQCPGCVAPRDAIDDLFCGDCEMKVDDDPRIHEIAELLDPEFTDEQIAKRRHMN